MPEKTAIQYTFARTEQSIFSEIYFPKRSAYYGTIFNALRFGYSESHVKEYLSHRVEKLLDEFKTYPALFDPCEYTKVQRVKTPVSVGDAKKRIRMYKSPFKGWSTYSVDGVFFDKRGKVYEEATQVVRIMFRLETAFTAVANEVQCGDVLRSILFWTIARQGRLYEHKMWSKGEKKLFIEHQPQMTRHKRAFVEKHFSEIAVEVNKWIDDRALFIFAYLVRKFSGQVLAEQLYEEEIWVSNFFDQNLNVISRTEKQ